MFPENFSFRPTEKFSILVNLQLTSGLYVPRPGVFVQAFILRQVFWLVPLNHLPDKQCLSVVINGLRNNGTYSSGHCGRFSQPSLLAAPHGGRTVFRLQIYDNICKPQIFQRIIFRKLLAALIHIKNAAVRDGVRTPDTHGGIGFFYQLAYIRPFTPTEKPLFGPYPLYAPSLASNITLGSITSTVCHTPLGIWQPYLASTGQRWMRSTSRYSSLPSAEVTAS